MRTVFKRARRAVMWEFSETERSIPSDHFHDRQPSGEIPQIAKTNAEMAGSTIRLASCPKSKKRWCRINGNTTPAHDGVTNVETESTQ